MGTVCKELRVLHCGRGPHDLVHLFSIYVWLEPLATILGAMKTLEYGPGNASIAGPSLLAEQPEAFANSLTRNLHEAPEDSSQQLSRCIWEAVRISGSLVGKALAQAQRCWLAARDRIGLSITWTPPGVVKACFTGGRDCILCSRPQSRCTACDWR